MSKILIQDLPDSLELDQAAMRAVMGGARTPRERLQQLRKLEEQNRHPARLLDLARRKQLARR